MTEDFEVPLTLRYDVDERRCDQCMIGFVEMAIEKSLEVIIWLFHTIRWNVGAKLQYSDKTLRSLENQQCSVNVCTLDVLGKTNRWFGRKMSP